MGFSFSSLLPLAGTVGGAVLGGPAGAAIGGGLGGMIQGALAGNETPQSGFTPEQQAELMRQRQEQLVMLRQVQAQQQAHAQALQDIANGKTPSIARTDLQAGLDTINRNALTSAAGAGGPGSALARYGAINAGADSSAQANQAAALAGVRERMGATNALTGLLGGMGSQAIGAAGQDLSGSLGAAGLRLGAEEYGQKRADTMSASGLNGLGQGLGFAYSQKPGAGTPGPIPTQSSLSFGRVPPQTGLSDTYRPN